ncbi:tectonic-like complex member MKS1 [Culicoides brevitarsis]|uniref:tectonic-like complex member MKS1 n=1 Tax=Culicoides brevitarsis TaxID=469753 RepID=UPI00307B23BA
MAHRRKCNQMTGIYRTADKIENLKIRVTFKTIFSLIKIPPYNAIDENVAEMQRDEIEIVDLKWQEKRLSCKEIQSYQYSEQCKTDLEKQYHEIIQKKKLTKEGKTPGKIFTYTAEDKRDLTRFVVEMPDDTTKLDADSSHSKSSSASSDLISSVSKSNQRKFGHSLDVTNRGFESYYIMIELHTEMVLITINYRKTDGLLVVFPDFNDFKSNPYMLEVDADTKQMYHFGLQNISICKKVQNFTQSNRFRTLEQSFAQLHLLPSEISLQRAFLLFQIVQGKGFEYDNLHVKFNIGIPPTTEAIHETGILYGSTHSSYKNSKGLWNFSYCHEIALECSTGFKFNDFLDMTFKVISIDEWKRERIEGFTMTRVQLRPGLSEKRELECYRVVTDSLLDRLKRYFIGDKGFQEDFSVKRTSPTDNHSRYGVKTITTGTLTIVVYLLMQNKAGKIVLNPLDD